MRFKYYSENLNLATADRCAQDYINGATSYNIFIHVQWSYLHIAKRTSHEKILQHINHLFKNFNFGTKLRDRKVTILFLHLKPQILLPYHFFKGFAHQAKNWHLQSREEV